jgi:bifunctional non-homologous end joining protein LigD
VPRARSREKGKAPGGATREPFPTLIHPMLASTGDLPAAPGWAFEFKWDGIRAVIYCRDAQIRLLSRNDRDVTVTYPELEPLGRALAGHAAVLDAEIVALDADGRPSFGALQHRMGVMQASKALTLSAEMPVVAMLFDVMHLDGVSTIAEPYTERRRILDSLGLSGSHWQTPPWFESDGESLLVAAESQRLEGVMAKRAQSAYTPGRRSESWRKVKVERTQSVVVGGFTLGRGRREKGIGALLLGIPEHASEELHYIGKVGTGFSDAMLKDLERRLRQIERSTSPFSDPVPAPDRAGAVWCKPHLVGEVRYGEWTAEGRLRHPVWLGLRPDLDPGDVHREP